MTLSIVLSFKYRKHSSPFSTKAGVDTAGKSRIITMSITSGKRK